MSVRWLVGIVCTGALILGLGLGLWLPSQLDGPLGGGAVSSVEAPHSEDDARELAYERCSGRTVGDLARTLGTPDNRELVAAAVAVKAGNPPVAYKVCLRLLRD